MNTIQNGNRRRMLRLACMLSAPALCVAADPGKPRVFVAGSSSWEIGGAVGVGRHAGGGAINGGSRPQTVEIIKTFAERCPEVAIVNNQDVADYVVILEHEGGKALFRHDTKVAVFDKQQVLVHSASTRTVGGGVAEACRAIAEKR